ncbi:class I SAM-dependent methyltransferase [Kribbella sp. NPDC023972]|jgi:SAM-dependent methyltransferase|uniref:class I SAM-dependent methyltransferase n=1 Tax=Kribbella sp. NPDC023972 TaxID=3154795 RepID=UPI0033C88097
MSTHQDVRPATADPTTVRVASAVGLSVTEVADVLDAWQSLGNVDAMRPEDGFHITRLVMYERIRQFFRTGEHRGAVLEVGGGHGAIHAMFEPAAIEYTPTDVPQVDVHDLPYESSSFDYVICDQVIEHVRNPFVAVNEMHRVLKPGGWLLLATCFHVPVHKRADNPTDYWRFTTDGLRELVRDFSTVYQCEGWGNREAISVIHYGGPYRFTPVRGREQLERIVSYNEPDVPISVWAIVRK